MWMMTDGLKIVTLSGESFLIGRAMTCHLVFDNELMSREHARIDRQPDGRFRLRDLGSRNKTYVNGQVITETLLSGGDMVRAGGRVIEFVTEGVSQPKISLDFLTPDRTEPADAEWLKVKAPIALTTRHLEQLSRLTGSPGVTSRPADIADSALSQIMLDLQADRGFVALRGEAKLELNPIAQRALTRPPGGSLKPVSQAFVFATLLQSVAGRYPQTVAQLDTKCGYAVTALVAPLIAQGNIIGLIYLDRPSSKKPFAEGGACARSRPRESNWGRSWRTRRTAWCKPPLRKAPLGCQPCAECSTPLSPQVEGSETFEVALKVLGGSTRCGDLCDVVHVDDQRCAVILIDGGGHGISGMAQAAALRTGIRATLATVDEAVTDPGQMFSALNRTIASTPARQVVPCTFVGIDLGAGRLSYINAGGMPPLLMVAPGRLVTLDQPSLVLGVDPAFPYETVRADLPDSFRLLCHSDGLSNATNASGECLGDQRLHDALLERETFTSAEAVVDRVFKCLSTHLSETPPGDDALLLVVAHR